MEEKRNKFIISNKISEIEAVSLELKNLCHDLNLDQISFYQLNLCLNEAISNVFIHAYSQHVGRTAAIEFFSSNSAISISIIDDGISIPFSLETIDLEAVPNDGVGLFLIMKIMDSVKYERQKGGQNKLTMTRLIS